MNVASRGLPFCLAAVLVSHAAAGEPLHVQIADAGFRWETDAQRQQYTLWHDRLPVLRYNFGTVPMPPGREPSQFPDGRSYGGARSDYIHPLYGLWGEVLTEDYPEHPHHRGLWWSWPVVRWGQRVADIWAVCDVWARAETLETLEAGPEMALLKATNLWKFGAEQQHPIVRETVVLRVFPATADRDDGRCLDLEISLVALEQDVAIGGRPDAGYGGLALRAAPGQNQRITPHVDDAARQPRRAWCQYAADFPGSGRRTAVVLLQHAENPGYPSEHNVYPDLNCFMPAFPGDREFSLPRGKTVVLRHRVWLRAGEATTDDLCRAWDAYHAH